MASPREGDWAGWRKGLGGTLTSPLYLSENCSMGMHYLYKNKFTLSGVTQWIECQTVKQRITGSIPS